MLSEIDGVWSGNYLRQETENWPELFFYSKRDWYLPWKYMEETIRLRRNTGR